MISDMYSLLLFHIFYFALTCHNISIESNVNMEVKLYINYQRITVYII